jgi:hypothetical protein
MAFDKDRLKQRMITRPNMIELQQWRAGVATKWIGLRRPVELTGPWGIPMQMVLGRFMVGEDLGQRISHNRS